MLNKKIHYGRFVHDLKNTIIIWIQHKEDKP